MYFATGLNIAGEDYTCKSVIGVDSSKNCYYDQSLSTIEKGRLVDYIFDNKKAGNLSPLITQRETDFQDEELDTSNIDMRSSPYVYYDKRLLSICQVPQFPYMEQVNGIWQPTKETIELVKARKLHIEENNIVVAVGVAPTISELRFPEVQPATRLRPSPTTNNQNLPKQKPDVKPDLFYASYIHSDEFISRFGDWEKANRLEKLKKSPSVVCSGEIRIIGSDVSDLVIRLRKNYSKENLRQLQKITRDAGREIIENLRKEQHLKSPFPPVIKNIDSGKEFKLQMTGINEIKNHNIFQKGHIEAISSIPEIIKNGIFISSELNEDSRKPEYKKFHYFATGYKLEQEDYSCKIVFTENKEGEIFYDQSLSTIEKGKLVDILKKTNVEKKKPDNSMEEMPGNENAINPLVSQDDSLNTYYDKRLINICQVPQMPYLTQNDDGLWTPTQEAIKAVMNGTLYIKKRKSDVLHG